MNNTRHYNLPLFEASDKPSILVDWNETMQKIDTAMFTIATGGDSSVVDAITALQLAVTSLQNADINHDAQIANIVNNLSTLASNFSSVFDPEHTYNTGDIVLHEYSLYEYTDPIPSVGEWDGTKWSLRQMTDFISAIRQSITDLSVGVRDLDTRVTALENNPGGLSGEMLEMYSRAKSPNITDFINNGYLNTSSPSSVRLHYYVVGFITSSGDVTIQFQSSQTETITINDKSVLMVPTPYATLSSMFSESWTNRDIIKWRDTSKIISAKNSLNETIAPIRISVDQWSNDDLMIKPTLERILYDDDLKKFDLGFSTVENTTLTFDSVKDFTLSGKIMNQACIPSSNIYFGSTTVAKSFLVYVYPVLSDKIA